MDLDAWKFFCALDGWCSLGPFCLRSHSLEHRHLFAHSVRSLEARCLDKEGAPESSWQVSRSAQKTMSTVRCERHLLDGGFFIDRSSLNCHPVPEACPNFPLITSHSIDHGQTRGRFLVLTSQRGDKFMPA